MNLTQNRLILQYARPLIECVISLFYEFITNKEQYHYALKVTLKKYKLL